MSDEEHEELTVGFDRLLTESGDEEEADEHDDSARHLVEVDDSSEEDEEEENDDEEDDDDSDSWSDTVTVHDSWNFDDSWGTDPRILAGCYDPIDFYCLFLNADVLNLIVDETNRYGQGKDQAWAPTEAEEMKNFFGLCLQMGVVKLPKLRDYWSSRPVFGGYPIGSQVMPRNRFEKLMANLHLADNASFDGSDRLYKISPFITLFNAACERIYRPGRDVCIDESLVPFRGRIVFRQYIPNKRHRYGIKLFKLCSKGGYTYKTIVYAGKDTSRIGSVAESVVMKLMDGLLDNGRRLFTDNWYTSIPLAETLIKRKTHMIGTVRRNRRGLPKQVTGKKLKRGSVVAQQNRLGVTVLKWRDKRDVLMLSTTHDDAMSEQAKPMIVQDYNQVKLFVDTSDQMASYSPYVRKTSKWYIRLFFHLLTQTALVNAWRLYSDHVQKIKLTDFKIEIIESLLDNERLCTLPTRHTLEELAGRKAVSRKRCTGCYRNLSTKEGSRFADKHARKVNTRCSQCHKHFCIDCFAKNHKKCSN
jgi:hypothetical protein